jgi:hypothetical protein
MRVLEVRDHFGIQSLAFTTRPDPRPGPRDVVMRLHALDAFRYLSAGSHFGKVCVRV